MSTNFENMLNEFLEKNPSKYKNKRRKYNKSNKKRDIIKYALNNNINLFKTQKEYEQSKFVPSIGVKVVSKRSSTCYLGDLSYYNLEDYEPNYIIKNDMLIRKELPDYTNCYIDGCLVLYKSYSYVLEDLYGNRRSFTTYKNVDWEFKKDKTYDFNMLAEIFEFIDVDIVLSKTKQYISTEYICKNPKYEKDIIIAQDISKFYKKEDIITRGRGKLKETLSKFKSLDEAQSGEAEELLSNKTDLFEKRDWEW